MRDFKTPEQTIRAIMEAQANAATLEYGTDLARDTYADDTPGQVPGDHKGKFEPVLANKTATAVDGVPKKGGEMIKPNPERLAGLGQKESYKGNPYLQMAQSDIIQENAYDQFVEMSDVEFDDMLDVLTIEELNDLEEGIIAGTGKLLGAAAKGVGKLAVGAVKGGAKLTTKGIKAAANRMSTKGRADAAEKKLKKLTQKRKDKERLAKAKQGLSDLKTKDNPIKVSFKKTVQDSYELGSRDYWTEQDEQDLTEGKMSKAEVKKHAAAIFKMRQQSNADKEASKALSTPKSAAAKAARRDAAAAGYGKPSIDPADRDSSHKEPKRGRGQKDLPHIVSQLRGVVDTKKGVPSQVKFKDGSTKNVNPKHAQSWLKKHDSAKPNQKLDMYKSHDSHKSFKSYAKEAVEADDKPKLKKLAKGLQGSVKGHAQQVKDIEKIIKDEKEVKNCGCGQDPCKTYGSKEEQMKDMQEAPGQRAWDRSSKGRAYRRLSDEEKTRLLKKNELMRRAKAMKGDDAAYSTSRMRKPTLGAARQTYKGKKKTRREHNEMMEGIILGIEMKFLQEDKDKCGPGEYWCTKDMKCKPIPKGMTTDKDGMLVKESFKHYEVTHKPTGKKYKVTAMHDKSAKEKARAQHGGTASRYSGTSTDDFHTEEKMAGVEYYPRMKKHGKMTDAQKKAVTSVYDQKPVDKKMSDDPHVKKAQRYMKIEQVVREYNDIHHGEDPSDATPQAELENERSKRLKAMNKKKGPSHVTASDINNANSIKGNQQRYAKLQKKMFNRSKQGSQKEEVVNEISNKLKTSYVKRAGQDVSHLEKLKDRKDHVRNVSLDRDDSYGHRVVSKKDADKVITKRRKGMRMAVSKLNKEEAVNELYPSHNTGTIDMDKHRTPAQKKAAADHAKKREAFAKKYPNASTSEKMFAKLKSEEVVNEISDKTKVDYIKKAKKQITDMEKHDLDRDTTTFVPKLMKMKPISYSKLMKRRRGVRTATGKLGEMSMSVTLKPKKDNMYKVTKVGDKMKKHGGIKKGEKFHDSQIDGMHDSGIKVKYHKEAMGDVIRKGFKD